MAHAKKPDLIFQRNGRVHLNWRRSQFSRLLAAEVCASAIVMLDTACSEVQCKTTGYPLHSHVSPSLLLPCVTVCHQVSTELYWFASGITTVECSCHFLRQWNYLRVCEEWSKVWWNVCYWWPAVWTDFNPLERLNWTCGVFRTTKEPPLMKQCM